MIIMSTEMVFFMLLSKDPLIKVVGDAANGKHLFRLFKALQLNIIITDIRMLELDSISVIREIVQVKPGAKIIALSSFGSNIMVPDALEAGAMSYLVKNADCGEITKSIRWCMQETLVTVKPHPIVW